MTKKLFSTDTDHGTITVIDPELMETIAKIPVGNSPRGGVMFTSTGRGFVGNSASDYISEIDPINLREVAKIKVGIAPMGVGIAPGDNYLLVSNSGSNYISIVDLNLRKEIHQIHVGREPRHMAISKNGEYAFVAVSGADYISKINISALTKNPKDLTSIREIDKIYMGTGSAPYSVGLNPTDDMLIVANNQVSYASLILLNTDDNEITKIDLGNKGGRGAAFSPEGDLIFVTIEDTSEIVVIDVTTKKIINRYPTGPGPRGFAIDPENFKVYIAGFSRGDLKSRGFLSTPNTISVLDLSSSKFVKTSNQRPNFEEIVVGAGPCSVTIFKS